MKKFINTRVANAIFAMVLVFIANSSIFAQITTTLGGYKVFTNGKANNFIVPESTYKGKAAYPKTGADIAQAFDTYERAPFFRLTTKEHLEVLIIGFNNSVRVISKAMRVPVSDTIAHNNYRRMIEIMNQSKRERYTYPLGTKFAALDPKDSTVVWIAIPNDSLRNSLVYYTPDNIRIPVAHWECGAQPPFLEDLTETEKCLIKIDTVTVTNNLKAPPPPIIPPAPQNVVNDTCCDTYTTNNYYYYGTTQAPQKQYVDYGSAQPLYWGVDYCCGGGRNYTRDYQGGGCYDCGGYDWGFSISFGWSPSHCYERANNNYCCAPNWEHDNYSQVGDYYYNYEDNDVTNVTNIYNIDNSTHVDDHSTHTTTTTTGTTPGTGPVVVYPDPVTPGGTTDPPSGTTVVPGNDGGNTDPTSDGGGGNTDPSSSGKKENEQTFVTEDGKLRKQWTETEYRKNGQIKSISTKFEEHVASNSEIQKYGSQKQQAALDAKVQPTQQVLAKGTPATQFEKQSGNTAAQRWADAQKPQTSVSEQKTPAQTNIEQKPNVQKGATTTYAANGTKVSSTTNTNVGSSNVSVQKYDAMGRKISNEQALALANNTNGTNNDVRLNNGSRSETQRTGLGNSSQNLTKGNVTNLSKSNQQVELSNRNRNATALKQNTPALKQQGQPTKQVEHRQPQQPVKQPQQNRGPAPKQQQSSHVSNNKGGGNVSKAGGKGKF